MSRLQDLPSLHPSLTLSLSDQAGTPIISSSSSHPSSSLNLSALAAYTTAQRLNLGVPLRIMVECVYTTATTDTPSSTGPVVINTFIPPPPPQTADNPQQQQPPTINKTPDDDDDSDGEEKGPPLLVAVVVAPDGEAHSAADARMAASRLARVGRRIQARWAEEVDGVPEGSGG